ncbi:hypothetical protein [Nannocystis sp. SCPEA4]|uniref:hypothetical protein n=1 Tax=Nannocystis sp. SCPEA4 TaxID=2996787 RepID=UPI0022719F7F|nr:hypothetical protein [Nannocystis sp. SCPEA4]MCY1058515.1 hypothetical protein [Nannocystis sp. SCPEA4]
MKLNSRLQALFTTGRKAPLPAALALVQALALGCGEPGSETSATSEASTTGDASTDGTSASPTTSGASTDDPTTDDTSTDASTTATTGEPGVCAQLCQRTVDCEVPVSLEQCIADCEAADEALRDCVAACDQPVCEDLLMCTSTCAQPGDPNAPPYASCEGSAATCQPGVLICINSAHDDLEFTVCAPYCGDNDECPVPATGTATPVCDVNSEPKVCSLDCSEGQQCPDDMVCDLHGSGLCMWPVG